MFQGLNVGVEAGQQGNRGGSAICFETPADYEITVAGKKLIGSAQLRRHKAVLQHGSLPLQGDIGRICDVLVYPDPLARETARQQVAQLATTLEAASGRCISWQATAQAFQQAFATEFDLELVPGTLTPKESWRLEVLRHEVYGTPGWTFKR
ncbi:MAG: hypothetical protein HC915_07010 [Anaerolineae bacterium]|nr:hypothetical protein [Anaerolineae bacterium]